MIQIRHNDDAEPVATRPLAMKDGAGAISYYTIDLTKNECELLDSQGDIATKYDYFAFGAATVSGETSRNAFQWSSEYADSDLGLVYYNYRHYEPVTGRWLSRDPILEFGGVNLYVCALNNVIVMFDGAGMSSCTPGTFNNVRIEILETSQAYAANLSRLKESAEKLLKSLGQMGKAFEYTSLATAGGLTGLMWAIVENSAGANMAPSTDEFAGLFNNIFNMLLKTPLRLDGTIRYEKCVCTGLLFTSWEYVEQPPISVSKDVPSQNVYDSHMYAEDYMKTFKDLQKELLREMAEELRR